MSLSQYAQLSGDLTQVLNANVFLDQAQVAAWSAAGNPKAAHYLPVTITAQPTTDAQGSPINPATEQVVQTGWTINPGVDVEPVWQVVALTAAQQTAYQNQQFATAQLVTSDLLTYINALGTSTFASLSATQQTTVVKRLLQAAVALIRREGGS